MLVEDVVMPANLIPLDIVEFDVILGTDWLHYNRANIDCHDLWEESYISSPGATYGYIFWWA